MSLPNFNAIEANLLASKQGNVEVLKKAILEAVTATEYALNKQRMKFPPVEFLAALPNQLDMETMERLSPEFIEGELLYTLIDIGDHCKEMVKVDPVFGELYNKVEGCLPDINEENYTQYAIIDYNYTFNYNSDEDDEGGGDEAHNYNTLIMRGMDRRDQHAAVNTAVAELKALGGMLLEDKLLGGYMDKLQVMFNQHNLWRAQLSKGGTQRPSVHLGKCIS